MSPERARLGIDNGSMKWRLDTRRGLGAPARARRAGPAGAGHEFGGGGLVRETGGHIVAYGRDFSVGGCSRAARPTRGSGAGGFAKAPSPATRKRAATEAPCSSAAASSSPATSPSAVTRRAAALWQARRLGAFSLQWASRPELRRRRQGGHQLRSWRRRRARLHGCSDRADLRRRRLGAGGLPSDSPALRRQPGPGLRRRRQCRARSLPAGRRHLEDGRAERIAVQANGRILVSVYVRPVDGPYRAGLVRLDRDGRLDRSFGEGGFLRNPIGGRSAATRGRLRPDPGARG